MEIKSRLSSAGRQLRPFLFLVGLTYCLVFAGLFLAGRGFPYGLDNNESYSSWWHARNLYENGIAQTKGLTDEVFSTAPEASPFIHSHQGNFPRLFTFLIYALGFRSIESHILISTFTVGLAAILLAFHVLTALVRPSFAAMGCIVMCSNYLLFAQWQVSLYNVWHAFFFFSSLTCIQGLASSPSPRRWWLITAANFAALFYWEYVFTAFVTVLCALYALALLWRHPRRLLAAAGAVATGGAAAAAVLLLQLAAYMGWANVLEDIRLTLSARNMAADPEILQRVASFYERNRIIFWHNFTDAAPLRTAGAFVDSLVRHHLQYYTPALALVMMLVTLGALLGILTDWLVPRRRLPLRQGTPIEAGLRFLAACTAVGLLIAPAAPLPLLRFVALVIAGTLVLGRFWTSSWWGWEKIPWLRFPFAALFVLAGGWLLKHGETLFQTSSYAEIMRLGVGVRIPLAEAIAPWTAALVGLTCALVGTSQVFGAAPPRRRARIVFLVLGGVAAYAVTYRIFTGYVYSGYLHRMVPLFVFVTDILLAVAVVAFFKPLFHRQRVPSKNRWPSWIMAAAGVLVIFQWISFQFAALRVAPPDSYAFLKVLDEPRFRGASIVSNGYPAPMAARTNSWGYADPALFSGTLTLTRHGYEVERDLKYLWFADRDTNPDYLKPDLAIFVVQTPNVESAVAQLQQREEQSPFALPAPETPGLVRRSRPLAQSLLRHTFIASDQRHASIVQLDWDYPPFLRSGGEDFLPTAWRASLGQKLELSRITQQLNRRWRISLTPEPTGSGQVTLLHARIDGAPVFKEADFAAANWRAVSGSEVVSGARANANDARPLITIVEGDALELAFERTANSGEVRVQVNAIDEVIRLNDPSEPAAVFSFSSASPFGLGTSVPAMTPGMAVQTFLGTHRGQPAATVAYYYAHQEDQSENGTVVRIYGRDERGGIKLLDEITFLGAESIPVRMAQFRENNPDTVAEHHRVQTAGDIRSFEQWLDAHLHANPGDRQRRGVIADEAATIEPGGDGALTKRLIPLPSIGARTLLISVTPSTASKAGPEYFGLPFSATQSVGSGFTAVDFTPPPETNAARDFGLLRLRLTFPRDQTHQAEPLLTTGVNEAGDIVYVIYHDENHIRLGFDHWYRGGPITPPIPIDYGQVHDLEISIGSLYPSFNDITLADLTDTEVDQLKRRVVVRLNGTTVIDAPAEAYESPLDRFTVGENRIKGTSAGTRFSGTILSSERIWPGTTR